MEAEEVEAAARAVPSVGGGTKFVRTDATTEYVGWINDHWILYNPTTNYFYVSDPRSNHVIVLDAASETKVGEISLPGAYTIDDTPDHKTLYVATVFWRCLHGRPVAMMVVNRYLASENRTVWIPEWAALVMADGRVALLGGLSSRDRTDDLIVANDVVLRYSALISEDLQARSPD